MGDPDFGAVDEGDVDGLVGMMDATSGWAATATLRSWERDHLAVRPGERLLDVGCGPGTAARAFAGSVVALDSSVAMVAAARTRAAVPVLVGDAAALPVADGTFDAARSERTLQWVRDPAAVVGELRRVVRPGGRVGLVDTDWSSLAIDTGDPAPAAAVRAHVAVERRRPAHVGRRLADLCRSVGLAVLAECVATQVLTDWDPDSRPAPGGIPPIAGLAADMARSGDLPEGGAPGFVDAVEQAARAGRLRISLTIYSVAARRP